MNTHYQQIALLHIENKFVQPSKFNLYDITLKCTYAPIDNKVKISPLINN